MPIFKFGIACLAMFGVFLFWGALLAWNPDEPLNDAAARLWFLWVPGAGLASLAAIPIRGRGRSICQRELGRNDHGGC